MKNVFLLVLAVMIFSGCNDSRSVNGSEPVFREADYLMEVDELPQIAGGIEALQKNLVYPSNAKEKGIQGKVSIRVFLDEDGKVNNTEIIKSDNKELEQSAIDAIENTKFTPGIVKGEKVKTQIVIPIVFKLDGSGEDKENKYPEYSIEPDDFPMPVGGIQVIANNVTYPENEKKKGIQGQVIVLALISESGDVVKTEIVKGVNAALDNAAMEAIAKTKFTPANKEGRRIKSQVRIPVTFKLE